MQCLLKDSTACFPVSLVSSLTLLDCDEIYVQLKDLRTLTNTCIPQKRAFLTALLCGSLVLQSVQADMEFQKTEGHPQ